MNKLLELIGRDASLFQEDLGKHEAEMCAIIQNGRFLVIGGAGTIGSAVVRELFRRDPKILHVVDISENNLAELVRDLRSSSGYIKGEFRTFALDCGSDVFDAMAEAHGPYDYILNFSALKHVRSESDPFTLMRMIDVNIFNTDKTLRYATESGAKKYFCVSTDKASNPVNMMGASKCIMESFLMRRSEQIPVSTARFANVAFSDGSLPFAWTQRIRKQQPIAAPNDVRRYFVTDQEGAILCLMSTFFGNNRDLFFPKLSAKLHLEKFSEIAKRYLQSIGYEAYECDSEEEARAKVSELSAQGKWPCFFFKSDTTGEKDFEEFFTDEELVDWDRFHDIGVVQANRQWDDETLNHFERYINELKTNGVWEKEELVDLFNQTLTRFNHLETGKYLDEKM